MSREYLIFGSTALKHWFPDYPHKLHDLDYMSPDKPKKRERGIEYHWNPAFEYIFKNNKDKEYVDPDFLYTIKVSHAAWNIFWDKTIYHINFLKEKGCKLDYTLYHKLLADWEIIHGDKKRINLNKPVDEFFKDAVNRKYNHEWLHEYFAIGNEPMHNKIRPDKNKAWCSKRLWDGLSDTERLNCAYEELCVITTERGVLNGIPWVRAKHNAYKGLVTSMTTGWFNLFLILNRKELLYNELEQQMKEKAYALR